MSSITTKHGDKGETGLLYGGRVSKSDPRCEAYGTVDEAVSILGLARALSDDTDLKKSIKRLQKELFSIGAELATDTAQYDKFKAHFQPVTEEMTGRIKRASTELEEQVKLKVRQELRALLQQRESYVIQLRAERVARRRVERTRAFLELGRENISVRDVNEAQADLLRARNAVTAALINYRISELELQRDLGRLQVNELGLYTELDPNADE